MSSIWNFLSPLRTGHLYLAKSGNEMFGTVVKHGVNPKTATVRVSTQRWDSKYQTYRKCHTNLQVHDEDNYCVTGDKVVIKLTDKLSKSKAYYIKSIVKAWPRTYQYAVDANNAALNAQTESQKHEERKSVEKQKRKQSASKNKEESEKREESPKKKVSLKKEEAEKKEKKEKKARMDEGIVDE